MRADEYQELTGETEIYTDASEKFLKNFYESVNGVGRYPDSQSAWIDNVHFLSAMYCAGKLNGEAGEVAELIFKAFRGGEFESDKLAKLFKELGDVQWYVARLAAIFGWKLSDVMQANINKLMDRKVRGEIHGYGDER